MVSLGSLRNSQPADCFIDSHVAKRDAQQVVTSSAYILFYRRRSDHPLGGPKVEELLAPAGGDADSDAAHSREPSPGTGEGRRLDDSSRNGLSGLGAVGAAHQSGVGGLESQNHGLLVDDETQQTSIMTTELEDEGLGEETSYGSGEMQPWNSEPGWGFSVLHSQEHTQQPNNSDNEDDMFNDALSQDSTRVAGGGSIAGEDDIPLFSSDTPMQGADDVSDRQMRGVRESAPPPDVVINTPMHLQADGDEDEELPIVELRPREDGDMSVGYADK